MMPRLLLCALLLPACLLALRPAPAPAQTEGAVLPTTAAEAGHPFLSNFAPADYGAESQNWALVEDDRGVVYAGNGAGLLAYDGVNWRLLPMPNRSAVRSLARDADGRIWVGGEGDLGYLAADSLGRTAFVSLRDDVPETHRGFADVWETHATDAGVYFRTNDALFRWDGTAMKVFTPQTSFHVSFVVDGTFYVRQWDVGLMRMERTAAGDALRLVPGGERFAATRIYVMLPFDAERLLIGTREEGLFLYDGAVFEPFKTEADALLNEGGLYLPGAVLPGDRFALGTFSQGLVVIDRAGRLVEHLDRQAGLQNDGVLFPYVNRSGVLWLGLDHGMARVETRSSFTRYGAQAGLTSQVYGLARHEGRLYAVLASGEVGVLDPASRSFRALESPVIQALMLLPVAGDLLVAGSTEGVHRVAGDRLEPVRPSVSSDYAASALHQWSRDPRLVLVGTDSRLGVLRRSGTTWVDEGFVPGVDLDAWYLAETADGTLWMGTQTGRVARVRLPETAEGTDLQLDRTEVTVFGPEDGVPEGYAIPQRVGDEVYVTGLGETVVRFDETAGRFIPDHTFDAARTGHPLVAFGFREDAEGRVWISRTYEAPVVVTPRDDGTYTVEGAPLQRLRQERIHNVYPEADGVVWFLGDELIRYDTHLAGTAAEARPPLVRRVSVGEDSLLYGGTGEAPEARLPHGAGALDVAYAAPGVLGGVRFRTRLEGFDEDWSDWTAATERTYTNLPPGAYTFRVEAEGRGEAAYAFTVLPPWYRTWWAYSLYAVLFGLSVFAVDRVQRRRVIRKEQEKARERELEQAREIEKAHRALQRSHEHLKTTQAQLVQQEKMASLGQLTAGIAHEIKNPLNFINNFAEVNDELADELREAYEADPEIKLADLLDVLADLKQNAQVIAQQGQRADGIIRSMMQHASGATGQREATDVNQIVSEHVDLAYHGKRAQQTGFTCEIERNLGSDVGAVEVVPQEIGRVLLNLLGNAFDAVQEQPDPKVIVSTRRAEGRVEIRVSDNGPGIPAEIRDRIFEPFFTTKPTGTGTGLGLSLAYDIVTQGHGGTLTVESEPGQGATFVVTLPAG